MRTQQNEIRPQPGPQTQYLTTTADVAFYGGAGGGGKTFASLLEPTRHVENSDFNAVIFRRTTPMITLPGGLWDSGLKLYAPIGAQPKSTTHEFIFQSGMKIKMAHLEDEKTIYDYQGSEIPLMIFEELTHFTEKQFWYMFSRNRTTCGVRPYIRATVNPDKNSWVRMVIDWYIGEDGYPIKERGGVIRWFIRLNDELIWADSKEELLERFPEELPKSFTFIPAKLEDNKILMEKDPGYRANLRAMQLVDRMRMELGNWDVVESSGMIFKRHWFPIVDVAPVGTTIRYWDRAATEVHANNKDPDYTAGLKFTKALTGLYYVEDMARDRLSSGKVEDLILRTAQSDGKSVTIVLEQDPGQAGKSEIAHYLKILAGFTVKFVPARQDKVTRAKPVSAQAEHQKIVLVRGKWNEDFLKELDAFPDKKWHDDQVDTLSGAFNFMIGGAVGTVTEKMVSANVRPIASGLAW